MSNIPGRDPSHPDPTIRQQAADYLKSCVDFAVEVGAPIVVVLPAAAGKTAPVGVEFTDDGWNKAVQTEWEYAVDGTRELARYARARSITLAIEPLNRYESFLVTDLVKAKQFVHDVDVDNLKIHLDTFHMNIEEKDLAEVVFEAGDLLVSMHLSDSNRETPGCGHTDFSGIMESLQKISFQGYLVLEPVPPGSNPPFDAARPSAHYYRDIYAKEGIDYLRKLELKLKDGG